MPDERVSRLVFGVDDYCKDWNGRERIQNSRTGIMRDETPSAGQDAPTFFTGEEAEMATTEQQGP